MHVECTCGITCAIAVAALYIRMGLCKLCYAFHSSVLELAFSTAEAEIGSFSKANGRLSATWNMSLLDLLLV